MDQTPQELDLTPEIVNIEVQQGTDVVLTFQLTDNDGIAVDITNDEVKFTAKDDFAGTVKIATKTNGIGEHADPLDGQSTFVLTKANLTTLTPSDEETWKFEVRRVTSREVIYIHGNLVIKPSVGLDA